MSSIRLLIDKQAHGRLTTLIYDMSTKKRIKPLGGANNPTTLAGTTINHEDLYFTNKKKGIDLQTFKTVAHPLGQSPSKAKRWPALHAPSSPGPLGPGYGAQPAGVLLF